MSTATAALLDDLALLGKFPVFDGLYSTVAAAQAAAPILPSQLNRVVKAVSTGSFVLRSLATEDAPPIVFVVNESAATINIYPFIGETMNGSLNGAFQITTGTSGIFVAIGTSQIPQGASAVDWRAALIP